MKHDWKKEEKQFYLPKTQPELITIPPFKFFSVEGQGNPNDKFFSDYITVLYSLSYAVKMSLKDRMNAFSQLDYIVYPLEGIWDISGDAKKNNSPSLDKNSLLFNLMIRQPDFISNDFAKDILQQVRKKKPHPLLDKVRFGTIHEKDSVQMLHVGSYDDEPASFRLMEEFCRTNSLIRESKQHREIYLSDARRVAPDRLRTVLRFKVTG